MTVGRSVQAFLQEYGLEWEVLLAAVNELERRLELEKRLGPDELPANNVARLFGGINSLQELFELDDADDPLTGRKNLRQLLAASLALLVQDRTHSPQVASDVWRGLRVEPGIDGSTDLETVVGYFQNPDAFIEDEDGLGTLLNSIYIGFV